MCSKRLSKPPNSVSRTVPIPLAGPSTWSNIFKTAMLGMMQDTEASDMLISFVITWEQIRQQIYG